MTAATISQPGTAGATAPDLTTTAGKLADLRARIAETHTPMGQASVDRVHDAGKKIARERIEYLLDDGSFVEVDALARHRSKNFGLDAKRPITDGVVTGYDTVEEALEKALIKKQEIQGNKELKDGNYEIGRASCRERV